MSQRSFVKIAARFALLFFCLLTIWQPAVIYAQAGETVQELKQRASELVKQQRYTQKQS